MNNFLSKMAISQIIEYILLFMQLSDVNPKKDAKYSSENAYNAIIPNEQGVSKETDKRLADSCAKADMNKKMAMTRDFMFPGALVKAYSRPVMDAKISLNAMRTYLVRASVGNHTDWSMTELTKMKAQGGLKAYFVNVMLNDCTKEFSLVTATMYQRHCYLLPRS